MQEDNTTRADTQHDPFVECYRAWLKEKQFSSGTGADFLASFSNTSGTPSIESPADLVVRPNRASSFTVAFWMSLESWKALDKYTAFFFFAGSPIDQWMHQWIYA